MSFIRKFMIFFGPVSSIFDFATFGMMLWVFHAGPALFRSGWFVESLATQTLVIFVIRTRRIPFFRSRPSVPLLLAALAVVAIGAVLPFTPLGRLLGFRPLPGLFFLALAGIVICYLALIEIGKYWFYRLTRAPAKAIPRHRTPGHRVHRRAARFATPPPPAAARTHTGQAPASQARQRSSGQVKAREAGGRAGSLRGAGRLSRRQRNPGYRLTDGRRPAGQDYPGRQVHRVRAGPLAGGHHGGQNQEAHRQAA
jgi:hypothetical protein